MSTKQAYLTYARAFGKDAWGNSAPEHTNEFRLLNQMFPDARFIHLVRDGHDVALSIIRDRSEPGPELPREAIKILWTGGWDSTFRVAWLMAVGPPGTVICPYYLVDPVRKSAAREIQAMAEIARALEQRFGRRGCVLKPPILLDKDCVLDDEEVERSYRRIRERQYIGGQYRSLAAVLRIAGPHDLELCIHKDDKAHQLLGDWVEHRDDDLGGHYVVGNGRADEALETLFRYYRFPLFEMSKTDMQQVAATIGIDDILTMSWFCHAPDRRGQPCGVCEPCTYTIEEGLQHRIPLRGRLRYTLSVRRRIKKALMAGGGLLWTVERTKRKWLRTG